tara:strand:+ start:20095 stop:20658 length:564 start_codon:yes stop_codon:yes gene_type:complete
MRSPFYFVVTPKHGKRYINTKIFSDVEFVINTSEENYLASNREAIVVSTPINYTGPISKGDILLVHHNVFKFYNDMKGRKKSGKSYFKDDLFFVDNEQFYLYKKKGEWFSHDRYCFVKPVDKKKSFIKKLGNEEPLIGKMIYPNKYLKQQGVDKGINVCFQPDSEYEFTIDNERLYRMYDHQITMII